MMFFGVSEFLIMMLLGAGAAPMGMVPGEMDPNLQKIAPEQTVIYHEWSSFGKGTEGGNGLEGIAADPEIKMFIATLKEQIAATIAESVKDASIEEKAMGLNIPPLVIDLISRPGCIFLEVDNNALQAGLEKSLGEPTPEAILYSLRGAIVINGGDRADAIAKSITGMLKLLPAEARSEKPLDHQVLPIPTEEGAPQAIIHREGNYFVLSWGTDNLDSIIASIKDPQGGLTANKRFNSAVGKLDIEKTGTLTFVDIAAVKQTAVAVMTQLAGEEQGPAMVNGVLMMLGLQNLEYLSAVSGTIDGQAANQTFLFTGGGTDQALSLFGGRALKAEDFSNVPADADMVLTLSMDWQKVLSEARKIIGAADPPSLEAFEEDLKILEYELGLKLDDVFEAFGHVWTLQNAPSTGGMLFTSPVLSLEVKDKEKAAAVFGDLMKLMRNLVPGDIPYDYGRRGIYLTNRKFMDHVIYFVNPVGQNDDMPFTFAFCLTEDHLYATTHVQALKGHLRFLASDEKTFADVVGDDLGDGCIHLTHTSVEEAARVGYAFLPWFASMAFGEFQSEGFDMTAFEFPSARAITPYIMDGKSSMRRTDDGILMESRAALPTPGGAGIIVQWFAYMTLAFGF